MIKEEKPLTEEQINEMSKKELETAIDNYELKLTEEQISKMLQEELEAKIEEIENLGNAVYKFEKNNEDKTHPYYDKARKIFERLENKMDERVEEPEEKRNSPGDDREEPEDKRNSKGYDR